MTDSPAPLIEDLFCQGHPLDHVVDVGAEIGWTRDDVMAVLREQQWDLDGSGRLPRSKRVTLPRGLRSRPAEAPPRRPSAVPDPLTGRPLPTGEPTPEQAMAEQAELDVDVDLDTDPPASAPSPSPEPAPAPPQPEGSAEPALRTGRQPKPIEHGTVRGAPAHKRQGIPIPEDDSCGCLKAKRDAQAAYQRAAYARQHPKAETATSAEPKPTGPDPRALARKPAPPSLPPIEHGTPAGAKEHIERGALPVCDACGRAALAAYTAAAGPTAAEIRAQVDGMAARVHPDGSINTRFVAIESTLRSRHGLPSYIAELDGPGKFRPAPAEPPEIDEPDPADEHDTRHSVWVEGCDGCVDRANEREAERLTERRWLPPLDDPRLPAMTASVVVPPDEYERLRNASRVTWGTPPAPEPPEPLEIAPYRPHGRDLDDWLDEASCSDSPAVREAAELAIDLTEELHDALDDLVRAEHAHSRGIPE